MIYHDTNCVKAHSKEACFQFIHPSNCYRVENVDVSTKIFSVSREKYLYLCPGTVLSLRVSTCDVTGPGRCWKQIQLEINLLSLVCVMSLVIISHHFRSCWWIWFISTKTESCIAAATTRRLSSPGAPPVTRWVQRFYKRGSLGELAESWDLDFSALARADFLAICLIDCGRGIVVTRLAGDWWQENLSCILTCHEPVTRVTRRHDTSHMQLRSDRMCDENEHHHGATLREQLTPITSYLWRQPISITRPGSA